MVFYHYYQGYIILTIILANFVGFLDASLREIWNFNFKTHFIEKQWS